ncbi:lissencephaly-1 [Anaeramoeba flamelloides]|uniref:Lissencephaly-1 n=1 Tax=Anaeramoeba flamelloides TaxID=1746091 RepID=A0ABQ8YY47_9EUKA|nr:lissencephaly-1 [Anaeramoeba flamelloides]
MTSQTKTNSLSEDQNNFNILSILRNHDFSETLRANCSEFVSPRKWVFKILDEWRMDKVKREKLFLLSGGTGVGKTLVLSEYIRINKQEILGYYYCLPEYQLKTSSPAVFIHSIVSQLMNNLQAYKKHFEDKKLELLPYLQYDRCLQQPVECFSRCVCEPLFLIEKPSIKKNYFFVIDGLDVSLSSLRSPNYNTPIAQILLKCLNKFPRWITIITSINTNNLNDLDKLEGTHKVSFKIFRMEENCEQEMKNDIKDYFNLTLKNDRQFKKQINSISNSNQNNMTQIINIFLKKSGLQMLTAHFLIKSIKFGLINTMNEFNYFGDGFDKIVLFSLNKIFFPLELNNKNKNNINENENEINKDNSNNNSDNQEYELEKRTIIMNNILDKKPLKKTNSYLNKVQLDQNIAFSALPIVPIDLVQMKKKEEQIRYDKIVFLRIIEKLLITFEPIDLEYLNFLLENTGWMVSRIESLGNYLFSNYPKFNEQKNFNQRNKNNNQQENININKNNIQNNNKNNQNSNMNNNNNKLILRDILSLFLKINHENQLFVRHKIFKNFFSNLKSDRFEIDLTESHSKLSQYFIQNFNLGSEMGKYEAKYLFTHTYIAKDIKNLINLSFNLSWYKIYLKYTDIIQCKKDIDLLDELQDQDIKLLSATLSDSTQALLMDPSITQLCQQLLLRVDPNVVSFKFWDLLENMKKNKKKFWFAPLDASLPTKLEEKKRKNINILTDKIKTYIKLTSSLHVSGLLTNSTLNGKQNQVNDNNNNKNSKLQNEKNQSQNREYETDELNKQANLRPWVESIDISSNMEFAVSSWEGNDLKIWDLNFPTRTNSQLLTGHQLDIKDVTISKDNKYILSVSDDRLIKLWESETQSELHSWEGHCDPGESCVFAPDFSYAASGGLDKVISIWSTKDWSRQSVLFGHTNFIVALSISPDSKLIASGSWDKTVRVWEYDTQECIYVLTGHKNWVNCVSFSRDGRFLISGSSDNVLIVWNVLSGREHTRLIGHKHCVEGLSVDSYSENENTNHLCVSCSHDHSIILWDFIKGIALAQIIFDSYLPSIAWSGSYVCCGDAQGRVHFLQLVPPHGRTFVYKEGLLIKQGGGKGGRKNWKKRWFVLGTQKLSYYRPSKKQLIGSINLINCKVKKNFNLGKEYCFEIQTKDRIWHLISENNLEMLEWIEAIETNSTFELK